jgi:tetratricopeptide (TPR) repeat protein
MVTRSKLWSRLKGDWQAAGDIYYREGQYERAAEMYERAGNLKDAARVYFQAGLPERGLEQLERAGEPIEAGDLLFAQAQYREAVRYYERGGAYWRAAEAAQRSNQPLRAAALFERAGAFEPAARAFERSETLEDALRCWGAESARLGSEGRSDERQRVDLHRAALLGKLRRFEEAAELLEAAGQGDRAAEIWLKARRPLDALRCLLDAGSSSRAASLLEQVGDEAPLELRSRALAATGRHRELGELLLERGDRASAIGAFESAGEWARAAEVAEEAGDLERAADLYARIDRPVDAARCFHDCGLPQRAAEAWLAAGEPRKAAGTFLEADRPLEAARAFIAAEDEESALRSLRAIDRASPDYEEATILLAPLLIERGEAAQLLQRLEASSPGDDERLQREHEYWRARAHEAAGELEPAAAAYSRLLANQRNHRDAARRLLDLRARGGSSRTTPPAVAATQPIGQVSMPELLEERYEIGEELGRGGMSRVFRAFDRERGERVALKILLSNLMAAGEAEQRLMNEFHICRRIEHPNVVRLFDFGRWRGTLYVTMELLEGVTLATLLDQGQQLPVDRVRLILADVLAGLEAAHAQQVVHRDLKPANIAVTPSAVKIMDFGIAYAQDSDLSVTRTGQVVGSPLYMSPEQIQGFELDARSDLYSLGVVAFTLLAGREPFRGTTPTAVSLKHLQEAPPDLAEIRPDLDPGWKVFVEKLLAKDREDRFAGARDARTAVLTLPVPVRDSQTGEALAAARRATTA